MKGNEIMNNNIKPMVGHLVYPADGSSYLGRVIYVSKEEDTIRHECLRSGKVYECSFNMFRTRYFIGIAGSEVISEFEDVEGDTWQVLNTVKKEIE